MATPFLEIMDTTSYSFHIVAWHGIADLCVQ
jgi:hypothetical protein